MTLQVYLPDNDIYRAIGRHTTSHTSPQCSNRNPLAYLRHTHDDILYLFSLMHLSGNYQIITTGQH